MSNPPKPLDPNKKLDIEDILENLEDYRPPPRKLGLAKRAGRRRRYGSLPLS